MKFKIAVVQFEITQFSPKINLRRAEDFIQQAASSQANIIVFPEIFITGPTERNKVFTDSEHTYRGYFQCLAKKYEIDIVPGSIIEEDAHGLHNTTYYIDSSGRIKARYRKVHLWLPERPYIIPGHRVAVFNTKYGKVGLIICWDLFFPEIFRKMVKNGVDIVFCPSYWCYEDAGKGITYDANSEIKLVDSLCVGRAFENEIIFVYCNAAGTLQVGKFKEVLLGHSQIAVPFKGCLQKLDHNKEEMFIQEVDTTILQDAENVYKIKADLKKGLVK